MSFSSIVEKINNMVWGTPFVALLFVTGIYLTVKLKLPQIKIIGSMFRIKKGKGISSYKSLMTILASTLGIGNITGVASAIALGGIGSIFWIAISGIIAMPISYVENYIVMKNRKKTISGYQGGSMYVLDDVLDKRKIAVFFALMGVLASLGMGAMVQTNSLAEVLNLSYGINKSIIAIVVILIAAYIILGGKYRLANICSILMPICTLIFVVLCISVVILSDITVIEAAKEIIKNAFGVKEVIGGIVGISIMKSISMGFSRGMFSNEAGMGTVPMLASINEEENTNLQAKITASSVFVDTVILCTLTGIAIVCGNSYHNLDIFEMIRGTFEIIPMGEETINICITCFAIATIPCSEYYGEQAISYIFKGRGRALYKLLYLICVYIGCVTSVHLVWDISSIANAFMAIPNLYMIYAVIFSKSIDFNEK